MKRKLVGSLVLLLAGYLFGLLTYRNSWPPISTYRAMHNPQPDGYLSDLTGKTERPCPAAGPNTAVILALGQSNGSNRSMDGGEPRARGVAGAFNFFNGHCYALADPLLGSDGTGNSVWTLVANQLIENGVAKNVVIAPFTVGGTSVRVWARDAWFLTRIASIHDSLGKAVLAETAVVWFQGEEDNRSGTSANDYETEFRALYTSLRSKGIGAPLFISVTTVCQRPANPDLQTAQRHLMTLENVRPGPDTDSLGYAFRWDGCHFTTEGRAAAARLWAAALSRP